MATITLPMASAKEQQELLVQTLAGIRSVLDEQGAELIGGHTMESRSASPVPASLRGSDHPHGERQQSSITLAENGAAPRRCPTDQSPPWHRGAVCRSDEWRHQGG